MVGECRGLNEVIVYISYTSSVCRGLNEVIVNTLLSVHLNSL